MADTALAGLPRIVRAADEIRWRGQAMLSLGLASACYWIVMWLVDGPVQPLAASTVFMTSLMMSLVLSAITSRRRLAYALDHITNPRAMVHETPADARERQALAAVVFVFGAVILLMMDTAISEVGATAALLAGGGIGIGATDLLEARRWQQVEASRSSRLFLMISPGAMLVRMGTGNAYELPGVSRPDDGPSPFDLPEI